MATATERTAGTGGNAPALPMPLRGRGGLEAVGGGEFGDALLGMDRERIAAFAARMEADMDGGEIDPLRMLALARKAIELFSRIERAARPRIALGLAQGEALAAHGCAFAERETGVRHDYSACGDAEWEELNGQIEALAARKKEREAFLRTIPARRLAPDGTCANPVFGADGAEVLPPLRSAALGIAVTIK